MNTQTHVNSHKTTVAVPSFEVWKNAFIKLLPQHAIKKSSHGNCMAWNSNHCSKYLNGICHTGIRFGRHSNFVHYDFIC